MVALLLEDLVLRGFVLEFLLVEVVARSSSLRSQ